MVLYLGQSDGEFRTHPPKCFDQFAAQFEKCSSFMPQNFPINSCPNQYQAGCTHFESISHGESKYCDKSNHFDSFEGEKNCDLFVLSYAHAFGMASKICRPVGW